MNQSSNKYLFDQIVSCNNCIYSVDIYYTNELACRLNHSGWFNRLYYASYIRRENYDLDFVPYFRCGPIGRFYESK